MNILLLNQCFYPDVVSTAQHLSDLARALVERGHRVTVVASRRGYDDPALHFAAREQWNGVDVRRISTLNLGKSSRWRRAVTFASFWISCVVQVLVVPRCEVVVALTSPPLIAFLAALLVRVRGGRLVLWLMDLNPDEALAAGWLRPESLSARALMACQRYSVRTAARIVVLDRFMAQRVVRSGGAAERLRIIPPWSHDDAVHYDLAGRLAFRSLHNLAGKYVVMYSGNHSPCHPLGTLLDAARQLQADSDIAFCFIGGGSEFARVQAFAAAHRLVNIVCLPYQPLDTLSASLSAADVHVVVMGDAFTGIVHPCKPYNILAVGLPLLYIGPEQSHIGDLLAQLERQSTLQQRCHDGQPEARRVSYGQVRHGDVDALVALIQDGAHARCGAPLGAGRALAARISKDALLPGFVELIEGMADRSITAAAVAPRPVAVPARMA